MMPAQRVRMAVAAATAGLSVITITPATADTTSPESWTVTDHTDRGTAWTVTDHTGPHASERRSATSRKTTTRHAATRRRTKVAGRARYPWRANTVCRIAQGRTWLVGPGDTLSLIAACHPGTDVDTLRARNGIRGDTIRVGQRLHIPAVNR